MLENFIMVDEDTLKHGRKAGSDKTKESIKYGLVLLFCEGRLDVPRVKINSSPPPTHTFSPVF